MADRLLLDIILTEILPRLPVKSVSRFKCVCKLWISYLSSPKFSKIQLSHVNNNKLNHSKLIVFSRESPTTFRIFDCEEPDAELTPSKNFPFKGDCDHIRLLASQNGLVCVGIVTGIIYSDFILWNPVTGEYKILSKNNSHNECYSYIITTRTASFLSLSYNSCEDDYQLLRVISNNVYIYSLKNDSWMKVDVSFNGMIPSFALLSENSIYFLEKGGGQLSSNSHSSYSLKRFDLTTKKWIGIATPPLRNRLLKYQMVIKVINGRLVLFVYYDAFSMWRVEKCTMDVNGRCWEKWIWLNPHPKYVPLHYMRNGNWLMYYGSIHDRFGYVYVADMKKNIIKRIYFLNGITRLSDVSPDGKFVETFESPNQYTMIK
ncbi:F-box protein At2g23160-like [Rutidosis leptorrhynchoides]|uniref:F-box protein At2g23160-like n=1 Tax=Rutidosis leptorrhynchoides TaxID=125765 RepID=UPI003A98EDD9